MKITFIFSCSGMFRDVPEFSGMFHVPGFIDAPIKRAIFPRNQSPSVSNSQRGWSCEQIFDSSTTFLNPLVGTNSLYEKRTVGFFPLPSHALRASLARLARVRLLRHALPISLLTLRKNPDCFAV